LAEERCFKFST